MATPLVTANPRILRRDPIAYYAALSRRAPRVRLSAPRSWTHPWRPPFQWLFTSEPNDLHRILFSEHDLFSKGELNRPFQRMLGEGLLTSDGAVWRRQRRLLQPAFSREAALAALPSVDESIEALFRRWDDGGSPTQRPDLCADLGLFTMDVVCRVFFGLRLEEETLRRLVAGMHEALAYVTGLSFGPLPWPAFVYRRADARFGAVMDSVDAVVRTMLDAAETGPDCPFLHRLTHGVEKETGRPIAQQRLRDEVVTVLHAGQNTLASALGWTFILLSGHPEWATRIRAEEGRSRRRTFADFLEGAAGSCLLEALRLYPPAWGGVREALVAQTIGDVPVPAGGLLVFSQYATHRHPDYWTEPTAFRPDRFTDPQTSLRQDFRYVPFGAGPRRCIGEPFAIIAAVRLLDAVLARYDLAIAPDWRERYHVLLDLEPGSPLPFTLSVRSRRT